MHYLIKRAAVKKYQPLHVNGGEPDEVKKAISADERKFKPEEVEEIYKAIQEAPAEDVTDHGTGDTNPVVDKAPVPPAPKPTPKATPIAPPAPPKSERDKVSSLTAVVIEHRQKYPDGVPLPKELDEPPINERGYVICSEYKGEVKTQKDKSKVWRRMLRTRANVKLTPAVFHKENSKCCKSHPFLYLPEVISKETLAEEEKIVTV